MSAWTPVRLTARPRQRLFHLVFESHDGRAPGADSEEKHEPVSDFDTVVVDSLKALDPNRPIREADLEHGAFNKPDLRVHGLENPSLTQPCVVTMPLPK